MRTNKGLLSKYASAAISCLLLAGCVPTSPDAKLFEAAAADLPHQIALAKASGLPFSADDLHVTPVKDKENAAPYYDEIEVLSKKRYRKEWSDIFTITSKTPDYKAKLKAAFQAAEPMLALARGATDLPHCRFMSGNGAFGHNILRTVARAFCIEAAYLTSEGDYAKAADCLLRASKVGDHYSEDPDLIAALTDESIKASICRIIERAYTTQKGDSACLQAFGKVLGKMQQTIPFVNGFAGEFVEVFIKGFSPFSRNDNDAAKVIKVLSSPENDLNIAGVKPSIALAAFESRVIEVDREIYDIAKENTKDTREFAIQEAKLSSDLKSQDRTYAMARALSSESGVAVSYLTIKAECDLNKAATEVLKLRNNTGQFPNTFSSTVPDPFTGKPFLYKKTADGFVLSSVGPKAIPGASEEQKVRPFTYPTKLSSS
jgi:hypothetical protein